MVSGVLRVGFALSHVVAVSPPKTRRVPHTYLVKGLEFRASGSGFKVPGLEFRV